MDCSRVTERLSFYLDGVLDEHTLELVEAHLSICPHCRQELAFLKMMVQAAGEIESVNPPIGLRTRIATAIREETVPLGIGSWISRWTGVWSRPVRVGVGSTAVACAAVAAVLVSLHPAEQSVVRESTIKPRPTGVVAKATETVDPGVVEGATTQVATRARADGQLTATIKRRSPVKRVVTNVALAPKVKKAVTQKPAVLASVPEPANATDDVTAAVPETRPVEVASVTEEPSVTKKTNKSEHVTVAVAPTMLMESGDDVMKQIKAEASMRRGHSGTPSVALFSSRF